MKDSVDAPSSVEDSVDSASSMESSVDVASSVVDDAFAKVDSAEEDPLDEAREEDASVDVASGEDALIVVAADVSSTNSEGKEERVEVENGTSTKSSGLNAVVVLVVLDDLNNETICFGDVSSALVVDASTVVVSDTVVVDSSVDSSLDASWIVKVGVRVVGLTTWGSNERDSLRKVSRVRVQTPSTHSVHSWIQSSVPHSTLQIIPKRSKDESEPESSSELLESSGSTDPRGLNSRFTPSSFSILCRNSLIGEKNVLGLALVSSRTWRRIKIRTLNSILLNNV